MDFFLFTAKARWTDPNTVLSMEKRAIVKNVRKKRAVLYALKQAIRRPLRILLDQLDAQFTEHYSRGFKRNQNESSPT